jgi:thioredoxin-related protein
MKNGMLSLAILATTLLSSNTFAQKKSLQSGDMLPTSNETLKNAGAGKDMSYQKAAGKNGLLVIFSCNTCPFVVKNESTILKTLEYAKTNEIGVAIINSNEAKREGDDSYDAMKKYAQAQAYTVPYLVDKDSKLADDFGANHTPEIFLFDNKSTLVYKGAMNDNPGNPQDAKEMYIFSAIDAVVAGKTPNPQSTKSIGCSIKRK